MAALQRSIRVITLHSKKVFVTVGCHTTRSQKSYVFFFFQAEDGIRDDLVTGVQTCALPISTISCAEIDDIGIVGIERHVSALARTGWEPVSRRDLAVIGAAYNSGTSAILLSQIGRASCRERV